ncbi:MAG: TRAP transporter substrate-binding protein [Lautropia sp.]
MQRRSFIAKGAAGAAAAAVAAPAFTQTAPNVRWRLASSFPKSLDTIFGGGEVLSKSVSAMTGGKFQISVHAGGEIVPGLQVLDAVQANTVECGHTALYYFFGKDPTWALAAAIPFGLNTRQFNAWWYHGGGNTVFNEFSMKNGVTSILCGNTTAQMGGWFRKEVKGLDDLKGLKFRIAGLGGQVFAKLGVVTQQIAGGDLYPALEKGTIDAAEWVGPYDDEKLGLNKVAQYYYYPGFFEGCTAAHLVVNNKAYEALPAEYKAALQSAAAEATIDMIAKYDALNAVSVKRLVATGTQLRAYPRPVLEAAYKEMQAIYAQLTAANASFKKVYDSYTGAQADQIAWGRVNEATFDGFMAAQQQTRR